jgi:hypothetical protein
MESLTKSTCEQRIDKELADRLGQFFPDLDAWSDSQCRAYLADQGRTPTELEGDDLRLEVEDTISEQAHEQLLSVEALRTFKLCLSYGGPADYFEIQWSEHDREWVGGRYVFQDWFDGASRPLPLETVERIGELFSACMID